MSRTDDSMNYQGSLDTTCAGGSHNFAWNAGSNGNMCETGFSYKANGKDTLTYAHKVSIFVIYPMLTINTLEVDEHDKITC